jgi:hypothetical protein
MVRTRVAGPQSRQQFDPLSFWDRGQVVYRLQIARDDHAEHIDGNVVEMPDGNRLAAIVDKVPINDELGQSVAQRAELGVVLHLGEDAHGWITAHLQREIRVVTVELDAYRANRHASMPVRVRLNRLFT